MRTLRIGAVFGGAILTVGCAGGGSTAGRDPLTSHVAKYDPPPAGLKRVKVGVPPFQVDRNALLSAAADQAAGPYIA